MSMLDDFVDVSIDNFSYPESVNECEYRRICDRELWYGETVTGLLSLCSVFARGNCELLC